MSNKGRCDTCGSAKSGSFKDMQQRCPKCGGRFFITEHDGDGVAAASLFGIGMMVAVAFIVESV